MPVFSKSQREVISARDCTLLVSAAAGSGKTTVLVQRVIEKLLSIDHPSDIDRQLVVTYTNAAAAEMKERIARSLSEVLKQEENAGNEHLQRQMLLLRTAPIMTIHSFCLSLLREFFYELSLDPSFQMADEAELVLMRADVMDELLERHYGEKQPVFYQLVETVGGGKQESALMELIERMYRFSQSAPFPERWLKRAEEELDFIEQGNVFAEDVPCVKAMMKQLSQVFVDCEELLHNALQLALESQCPYAEALESDMQQVVCLRRTDSLPEIRKQMEEFTFVALSRKKCQTSDETKEKIKGLREKVKKLIKGAQSDFFYTDAKQQQNDILAMIPRLRYLLLMCREYSEQYAKKKSEKGVLDFDDLEHYAVRLLVTEENGVYAPTATAVLLRSRYDEIMMDECQDSNLIQDLLIQSISREDDNQPNRFMVGDVKQSIYKFRMAMPELFIDKYNRYHEEGDYRKIVLSTNYRSRNTVIDFVNDVFSGLMQKSFGGIVYDEKAQLNSSDRYPEDQELHKAELLLTERKGAEEETDEEPLDKITAEAYTVGARIKKLMDEEFPVFDHEELDEAGNAHAVYRKLTYRDILVLFRSVSGYAETYLEVFSELSIPALSDMQSSYFEAQEVSVALNVLRIIDNPDQDIPLVSVLRSEMFHMTEEELALVKVEASKRDIQSASFYEELLWFYEQALEESSSALSSAKRKLARFFQILTHLREMVLYAGVPELLQELFRATSYPDFVRLKPQGERRVMNLSMLVEKASLYETSSYSGIFDFIRYIERLKKYASESGQAKFSAGDDAVRIMTIHKSKGLEAPVVIVAGLSKRFNFKDLNAELLLHPLLFMGVEYRDEELRVKAPTLYKRVIARQLRYEMLSEEIRILYVALTRAKEKLILSGVVPEKETYLARVEAHEWKTTYSELLAANNYMDFLRYVLEKSLRNGHLVLPDEARRMTEEAVERQEDAHIEREQRYIALTSLPLEEPFDQELERERAAIIGYRYPYRRPNGKRKLSVTELKRREMIENREEELFPSIFEQGKTENDSQGGMDTKAREETIPKFLRAEKEKTYTPAERGTMMHRILQCMDFTRSYERAEELSEELSRLVSQSLIDEETQKEVSRERLLCFVQTPLFARMQRAARAHRLHREQPFVMLLPYNEVYREEQADTDETVMVQGMMDAYFEEEGALILVDYKTDYVKDHVEEVLTTRYRKQLDYYEDALTRTTGLPVKERYLYSFTAGKAILC